MAPNIDKIRNLIFVDDFSKNEIQSLFQNTKKLKSDPQAHSIVPSTGWLGLLFTEASTRTRISFQSAAQKLGWNSFLVEAGASSSMSKGESLSDTFRTIQANNPDAIVVRCGEDPSFLPLAKSARVPVINAGFGNQAHPTQALTDYVTLFLEGLSFENLKILFVGDLRHSRVFSSHRRLARTFGVQVGVCAPKDFLPSNTENLEIFEDLESAIGWCDVYCGLRIQFERHENLKLDPKTFVRDYSLDSKRLKLLASDARILHPAPVNWGVEFQDDVQEDPRLMMWQQMENGLYLRASILQFLKLGGLS